MMEPTQYADDEVNLQQYLAVIRRRRWAILGTIAAVFAAGCVVTALMKPVYEAKARLLVRTSAPQVSSVRADSPLVELLEVAQPEPLNTQIEILQSGSFLGEVWAAARVPKHLPVQVSAIGDPDTNIVTIRVQSTDPRIAARIANTLLDLYLERTRFLSLQEVIRAREFVQKQAQMAQATLQRMDTTLTNFRRTSGLEELTVRQQSRTQELFQLEAQSRQTENDLLRVAAQRREVRAQLAQQPTERVTTTSRENPRIAVLQARIADATAERDTLLQSYRPNSVKVRGANSQIAALQAQLAAEPKELPASHHEPNMRRQQLEQLLDSYEAELQGLRAQRTQVFADLAQQRQLIKKIQPGPAEVRLAQLQRDRDTAERSYLLLAGKLQDLEIRENAHRGAARIFERAFLPWSPIRPRPAQNLAVALALGILLSGCLAFLLEYLDDRITSPEAVERLLGLPVLGYIPAITGNDRLMHSLPPYSPPAESYRGLRAGISFAALDAPVNTLAISSVRAGDGKSMTAVNLALAMAMDGRRVTLVDADLRWPTLHRLLDLQPSPGLTDVLAGRCSLEEAFQAVPRHQLLVLTSGSIPTNPAEMLNSAAMQHVVQQLSGQADIVIFDTPPCVPFTDAQVLGARLDGMLLVTEIGETHKAELQRARRLLDQAHIRVLGIVFNRIRYEFGSAFWRYAGYRSHYSQTGPPNGDGRPHDQVLSGARRSAGASGPEEK